MSSNITMAEGGMCARGRIPATLLQDLAKKDDRAFADRFLSASSGLSDWAVVVVSVPFPDRTTTNIRDGRPGRLTVINLRRDLLLQWRKVYKTVIVCLLWPYQEFFSQQQVSQVSSRTPHPRELRPATCQQIHT